MAKILLLVLDGMGEIGKNTPLETARKPAMDNLAKTGLMGIVDFGYSKKFPDSDMGYLSMLGSYSKKTYPGRGYLEALGIGLNPKKSAICMRANFATLDGEGNIIDRRAGRDETGLNELSQSLNMEIDGIKFSVTRSSGHRIVITIDGNGLSDEIMPNDTKEENVPFKQIKPKSPKGKLTASVLNKFLYNSRKILSENKINKTRHLPANCVLIRNVGMQKRIEPFEKRFGLKACCIAGVPIAKGVARFLGMDVIEDKSFTGMPATNFKGKFNAAISAIKKYDFVFLHFNGSDILSHDGKRDEKRKFIEKVDFELGKFLAKINLDITVAITCDHRTCSLEKYKPYRHLRNPVPILISRNSIKSTSNKKFSERECENGLKIKGDNLIKYLKSIE